MSAYTDAAVSVIKINLSPSLSSLTTSVTQDVSRHR